MPNNYRGHPSHQQAVSSSLLKAGVFMLEMFPLPVCMGLMPQSQQTEYTSNLAFVDAGLYRGMTGAD